MRRTSATRTGSTRTAQSRSIPGPSLRLARGLMRTHGHVVVAGMDEVGRGALAGPVTVGVVAVHAATPSAPSGLHDSKLLSAAQRERLEPRLQRWAPSWSLGHASNDEIDRWGILLALRVAGLRALAGLSLAPERVVLDGSYDWLRRPVPAPRQGSLLDGPEEPTEIVLPTLPPREECLPVDLVVKADQRCSAVAAASVLAKVGRDRLMTGLAADDPRWGWAGNKGYSAPEHLQALSLHGPGDLHRRSWRLPVRP